MTTHLEAVTQHNALTLVGSHDVVLDCTDNVETRYLLSDACAVVGVPLVSAAAVGLEGQLTVYCRDRCSGREAAAARTREGGANPAVLAVPAAGGRAATLGAQLDVAVTSLAPCYRCIFPKAPATKDCTSCARGGVLGPVPGVMGVLQALECIKVITGLGDTLAGRLLMFDAASAARPFAVVRLRGRDAGCAACGDHPHITRSTLAAYDYLQFTTGVVRGRAGGAACLLPAKASSAAAAAAVVDVAGSGGGGGIVLDDAVSAAARNASLHRGDGAPPWGTEATAAATATSGRHATSDRSPKAATSAAVTDPALHGDAPWALHEGAASTSRTKTALKHARERSTATATATAEAHPTYAHSAAAAVTLDVKAPVPRHARQAAPGRVTPAELYRSLRGGGGGGGAGEYALSVVLLDVRPRHLYAAAALRGSINVPLAELEERLLEVRAASAAAAVIATAASPAISSGRRCDGSGGGGSGASGTVPGAVYCVCSRGNDSQLAAMYLRAIGLPVAGDVLGGLERWREDIDSSFPKLV